MYSVNRNLTSVCQMTRPGLHAKSSKPAKLRPPMGTFTSPPPLQATFTPTSPLSPPKF